MRGRSAAVLLAVTAFVLVVPLGLAAPSSSLPAAVPAGSAALPAPTSTLPTYVILVHGFNPTTIPAVAVWTYGVDIEAQLVARGYIVGVVSYYGEFTLTFSNGVVWSDPTFFGTTNTPIESVGAELGKALSAEFMGKAVDLDIVGHSMGGLVTEYMLEHVDLKRVHLENVVFLGSPLGGAPLTVLSQYDNLSGYQAQEMEAGSPFLTALQAHAYLANRTYAGTEWLVYAGDADPAWGVAYFHGPDDGLVAVNSDTRLGYRHLYEFPDLHIPSLDAYDPGHVSYFEDPAVLAELERNFQGQY